jgi:hypothetical protein
MQANPNKRQKLNDLFHDVETVAHGHNKVYKRFRKVFEVLLEEASPTVWHADPDACIVETPLMDERLDEFKDTLVSSIVPLTGYTGIGKSTLIRHYFKSKGQIEIRDHTIIIPLFFNSRFNVESSLLTSLKAACHVIQTELNIAFDMEEFATFVYSNRPDLLFFDKSVPISLPKPELLATLLQKYPEGYYLQYLKYIRKNSPITQILIIVDDIESQEFGFQEMLLKQVFKAYKCLCNYPERPYTVNVLISLRPTTLKLLNKQTWYSAYPVQDPIEFENTICLEDLFRERFDYYVNHFKIKDSVENKDAWLQAYDILQNVAKKVSSHSQNGTSAKHGIECLI